MKHVFVVGCPRSGTTWVQLLLAQHPSVATVMETHVFSEYLGSLNKKWEQQKSRSATVGLRPLLSEDEFYALCGDFAEKVLQKIADTNPAATVTLEKTPQHVRHAQFILALFPNAHFIHIVRDPRSVVSSLRAAAHSWGSTWASTIIRDNAKLWCSDVTSGREIRHLTNRYWEIRYEDLKGSGGVRLVQDLFRWLELPVEPEFVARAFEAAQQALEACQIDQVFAGGVKIRSVNSLNIPNPESSRRGTVDGWKQDLSRREIETVEYIAKDLMQDYGYQRICLTEKRSKKPRYLSIQDLFDGVNWRVRAGLNKMRAIL